MSRRPYISTGTRGDQPRNGRKSQAMPVLKPAHVYHSTIGQEYGIPEATIAASNGCNVHEGFQQEGNREGSFIYSMGNYIEPVYLPGQRELSLHENDDPVRKRLQVRAMLTSTCSSPQTERQAGGGEKPKTPGASRQYQIPLSQTARGSVHEQRGGLCGCDPRFVCCFTTLVYDSLSTEYLR